MLAEKQIARPQDLVGKTVQIAPNDRLLFQALLTAQGIDPAQIKTVERTDFTSAPLIKGEAMFQAVPFLNPAGSRPGTMTDKTWDTTQRMMHDQGILKQSLDPKIAYTLAFLDKVYPK